MPVEALGIYDREQQALQKKRLKKRWQCGPRNAECLLDRFAIIRKIHRFFPKRKCQSSKEWKEIDEWLGALYRRGRLDRQNLEGKGPSRDDLADEEEEEL